MAQGATIYNFDINLSDMDRAIYEQLALRVAQHPTETMEYLLTRILAYCLEYREGIAFGESIGTTGGQEPAVIARDATGRLMLWVEVGMPDADKLHKASKAAERLVIYTHRDPTNLKNNMRNKTIYNADQIPIFSFEYGLLAKLIAKTERRTIWDLSVTEGQIYLTVGGETIETRLIEDRLG